MDAFRVKVTLTEKDLIEYNLSYFFRNLLLVIIYAIGTYFFITGLIEVLSLKGFIITYPKFGYHNLYRHSYKKVIEGFIILLLPFFIIYRAKKNFAANKRLQSEMEYTFTNEGILYSGHNLQMKLEWQEVKRFWSTKNFYVLKLTVSSGSLLLPKSGITDDQYEFIKTRIIQAKLKK